MWRGLTSPGPSRAVSIALSIGLVAGASVAGIRVLGGPGTTSPAAAPSGDQTVFPLPSASESPSPSPTPNPGGSGEGLVFVSGEQWGYPFPGDPPGCIDGTDNSCPHTRIMMSGIGGNRFIAIDIWRTPDEPKAGDTVRISATVTDPDDPYCCRVTITVDAKPKPTIIRCTDPNPTPGLVRTGGTTKKVITWKAASAATYVINVHARGNCGRPGGTEQTGWQYMTVYPKPSPSASPSPTTGASPTPSPTPTPTESAEPTATPTP